MANVTTAAGDNGVAGPLANDTGDLPHATVTGTLSGGDFSADKRTAIRHSVSKTNGTATVSNVYSETQTSLLSTDSYRSC